MNITASYHTLSGCRQGEPPARPLLARAAAAREAGITSIGACIEDLGDTDPWWLQRNLHWSGVRVTQLEWVDLDEPLDTYRKSQLFKMADVFHPQRIHAGVCNPGRPDMKTLTTNLRHLAKRAAECGVTIAVEPVVFGGLATIEQVQQLIFEASEPNVGTLLDAYHWSRATWSIDVSAVIPRWVAGIQLCGIDREPVPGTPDGLYHEAMSLRRLPSAGDFPVAAWLAQLRNAGVTAPLDVEVICDELRAMPLHEAAVTVAGSLREFAEVPVA